ncbi:hypothetical protein CGC21_15355 [Leishmania donovani]|uniref:Uncharacterized protein n=1 Tax=Leishmania donovani TaxID=5661 RepID=A0A504XIN9_LEIDO|nr:hypothetical protein CGC21_15355 [Leishmania donovani]
MSCIWRRLCRTAPSSSAHKSPSCRKKCTHARIPALAEAHGLWAGSNAYSARHGTPSTVTVHASSPTAATATAAQPPAAALLVRGRFLGSMGLTESGVHMPREGRVRAFVASDADAAVL